MTNKKTESTNQILIFKAGIQSYAVSIDNVKEIIKSPTNCSKYIDNPEIKGIISYRSGCLSIIDLAFKITGVETLMGIDKYIIIVENENKTSGFLVDNVENIQNVSDSDVSSTPMVGTDKSSNSFVDAIYMKNEVIYPILKLKEMV